METSPRPAADVQHDYSGRRAQLREVLQGRAALITDLVNVRYLTGFTGSHAALLLTNDDAVLGTDGRYVVQAGRQCPDLELLNDRAAALALVGKARADGLDGIAVEEHVVTVAAHRGLVEKADGMAVSDLGRAVEALRQVKDDTEIALLRQACLISTVILEELLDEHGLTGRTEIEVADELERRMREAGAEGPAFPTIVGAGENSAVPHHEPTGRTIARGDLVVIDFGARYGGYHADCTRTFLAGGQPADWQREIYDVVRQAQRAGRRSLKPGADTQQIDATVRDIIGDAGYRENFDHGLGHGVGLEIHEAPMMGPTSTARLADRTPVTVEPGIYLPGRGGVRIEDTLVVRDGAPELLTTFPKDLLVR